MSLGKLLVAMTAAYLLAGSPAYAAAHSSPGTGIPAPVTAAAKAMKCTITNEVYSLPGETPAYHGEGCKQPRFGQFTVLWYVNASAANDAIVHGTLAGHPEAFFARKGHLFVFPVEPGTQYNEKAARWAANKIGGKAVHGQ